MNQFINEAFSLIGYEFIDSLINPFEELWIVVFRIVLYQRYVFFLKLKVQIIEKRTIL